LEASGDLAVGLGPEAVLGAGQLARMMAQGFWTALGTSVEPSRHVAA